MTSGFDLAHAAKHFKFALIPKVSSELATSDVIELMAHDERSYKHWYYFPIAVYPSSSLREIAQSTFCFITHRLRALSVVINAFDQHGRLTIEHTLRTGSRLLYCVFFIMCVPVSYIIF